MPLSTNTVDLFESYIKKTKSENTNLNIVLTDKRDDLYKLQNEIEVITKRMNKNAEIIADVQKDLDLLKNS